MRATKISFVVVMLAMLLLPGAQMIFSFIDIPILQEYRRLAAFPDLPKTFTEEQGRLAKPINTWFDDNVGFRPLLTRINNQVDYSVFHYSRNVVIGKGGWFYDNSWMSYQVTRERQGEALQRLADEKMVAIAQYLAKHNVKLVLISFPVGSSVYPEFLPAEAPTLPEPNQYEKFNSFLKTRSDWIYIDGLDLLRAHTDQQLFFKLDHHPNPVGSYIVAREIVGAIASAEGFKENPWDRQLNFVPSELASGAFARYVSILVPMRPDVYLAPDAATGYDDKNPPPGQTFTAGSPPFETIYRNNGPRRNKLPPIVLFGNSFADWYASLGMNEYFSRIYRVRSIGQDIEASLRAIPPDARYFVFQFIEPYWDSFTLADIPQD